MGREREWGGDTPIPAQSYNITQSVMCLQGEWLLLQGKGSAKDCAKPGSRTGAGSHGPGPFPHAEETSRLFSTILRIGTFLLLCQVLSQ